MTIAWARGFPDVRFADGSEIRETWPAPHGGKAGFRVGSAGAGDDLPSLVR